MNAGGRKRKGKLQETKKQYTKPGEGTTTTTCTTLLVAPVVVRRVQLGGRD